MSQQEPSVIGLLRQVPGVHIDQAGARGGISSVYVRGGDPNSTVVLIDGVKVNDPTNSRGGSLDFSALNTENIERIEIVRRPLSAVYGSDALSGVINIITRRGGPKAERIVEVAGGRFGFVRMFLQARGLVGAMDYALGASYLDNGEPVEGSGFINKSLSGNVGLPLSNTMDLRWVLRYADSQTKAFPDDSGGPEFAVFRVVEKLDIQELTLGLTYTQEPFPWWEYHVQVGIYDRREDVDSPGVAPGARDPLGIPPSRTDNALRRYELTLPLTFKLTQGIHLSLGTQVQIEDGESVGSLVLRKNFILMPLDVTSPNHDK